MFSGIAWYVRAMAPGALTDAIARLATREGLTDTPIEGLKMFRISRRLERIPAVYPASFCAIVQGAKRIYLGGDMLVYGEDRYLCSTMPLPVEGEIVHASSREPVLGLAMSLETRAMTETIVEIEAIERFEPPDDHATLLPGMMVAAWDTALREALVRLCQILDDPVAVQMLGPARMRELCFAILRGEAGSAIRRTLNRSHGISRALHFVRNNLSQPISIDGLARHAGMSRAAFHRQFKAATRRSPLQFIKALRLNEAAMLLARGVTIGEAAERVGYVSASQFSREFRREYGRAPRQWANISARYAATDPERASPTTVAAAFPLGAS